jgi:hypothetical protein
MAWTDADAAAIKEVITSGAAVVRHLDKTVQNQPLDELRDLYLEILRSLNPGRQRRAGVAGYRKGV